MAVRIVCLRIPCSRSRAPRRSTRAAMLSSCLGWNRAGVRYRGWRIAVGSYPAWNRAVDRCPDWSKAVVFLVAAYSLGRADVGSLPIHRCTAPRGGRPGAKETRCTSLTRPINMGYEAHMDTTYGGSTLIIAAATKRGGCACDGCENPGCHYGGCQGRKPFVVGRQPDRIGSLGRATGAEGS